MNEQEDINPMDPSTKKRLVSCFIFNNKFRIIKWLLNIDLGAYRGIGY